MLLRHGFKIGLLCLATFFSIIGCDNSPENSNLKILDKTVYFPKNYNFIKYSQKNQVAEFALNISTFEPTNYQEALKSGDLLTVEVRALASEFGEKYYWTDKDPASTAQKYNCKSTTENDQNIEICEYKKDVRLNNSAYGGYSLKDKKSGKYISVFGCSDPHNERQSINKVCTGRARLLDNLQIEYSYRASHFGKALKIDQSVRKTMLGLTEPNN